MAVVDDDKFANVIPKNVMPIPPAAKKVFLEDFENFTVKYVLALYWIFD